MIRKITKRYFGFIGFIGVLVGLFPEIIPNIPFKFRIFLILGGIIVLIIWGVAFNFYSYSKKKIKYFIAKSKRIKIGINIDDKNLSRDIVKYCNDEIRKINLSYRLVFETYDINYKDLKKVHKNISKKNSTLDLVVWMTKNHSKKGEIPINFTYKNTRDNLIASIVHQQMSSLVSIEKMFKFHEDTFAVDLDLEKQNIIDFSLFIVSICTAIFRGNKEGIFIFEKLINKLKDKNGTLKDNVSEKLGTLYIIAGGDFLSKGRLSDSLKMYNKGFKLIPENRDLLAGRALAQFLNGDVNGAEETAEKLLRNNTNFPIAHLDIAFFRIKRKKYKNAVKHYSIYAKYNYNRETTLDAVNFLSKRIDEEPSELGYLFARAFLKRTLIKNRQLTKNGGNDYLKDFTSFIRRADGKDQYKDMIDVAKKYLDRGTKKQ